ncbi:twin-arginine translocase subunit TatC [Dinghuibacter silviterrae]|uniref:Sec-independent protein translocase protein TatC n=1 Tax=Dinghuibacter silviterrae TaxID=1539049 RepID=A0A4R8DQ19_9BACT|nr:twin-arginine translocase subunit TatC [Dinghuibacter silviterrae]TDX00212.1 sec-independent protein translocase protein TatC [Dinghuibacter silviterrae]
MKLFRSKSREDSGAEMSFVEHLEELRSHLFKSAVAVLIGSVVVGIYSKFIFRHILMGPAHADFPTYAILCKLSQHLGLGSKLCMDELTIKMQSNTVAGQFGVYFNVIIIGGFILAFPYVFYQFWKFFRPALTKRELRSTRGVIFWVSFLFFLGVFFGYFVIAPYTVSFFSKFQVDETITNFWTISSYFGTLAPIILGAGLAFQLPLVLFFLAKAGIVSSAFLKRSRKYAIIIILVLCGIITPPDMLSQIVCSVPLILLYEVGLILTKRVEKREAKQEIAEWS